MDKINPDHTAFPSGDSQSWGLTKREYFAALILQGLAANPSLTSIKWDGNVLASRAVQLAEQLIAELNI